MPEINPGGGYLVPRHYADAMLNKASKQGWLKVALRIHNALGAPTQITSENWTEQDWAWWMADQKRYLAALIARLEQHVKEFN